MSNITDTERNRVTSSMIEFNLPRYPTAPFGVSEVKNPAVAATGYKAYPTAKNVPPGLKASTDKRVKSAFDGYTGEVLESDTSTREGKGTQCFQDGSVLDGYWQANLFIKGRLISPEGTTLAGGFKDSQLCGSGNLKAETWSYEGDFDQGSISGKGRLAWTSPLKFEVSYSGIVKNGEFKEGKLLISSGKTVIQSIEGIFDYPVFRSSGNGP